MIPLGRFILNRLGSRFLSSFSSFLLFTVFLNLLSALSLPLPQSLRHIPLARQATSRSSKQHLPSLFSISLFLTLPSFSIYAMVKVISTILAISASFSVVFAIACPAYKALGPGQYPALDCVPYTQDPQVQAWVKLVDMTKVPVFPQSNATAPCPDLATIDPNRCWWTCQKCEAPADITTCPIPGTWGLTYDGKMGLSDRNREFHLHS